MQHVKMRPMRRNVIDGMIKAACRIAASIKVHDAPHLIEDAYVKSMMRPQLMKSCMFQDGMMRHLIKPHLDPKCVMRHALSNAPLCQDRMMRRIDRITALSGMLDACTALIECACSIEDKPVSRS